MSSPITNRTAPAFAGAKRRQHAFSSYTDTSVNIAPTADIDTEEAIAIATTITANIPAAAPKSKAVMQASATAVATATSAAMAAVATSATAVAVSTGAAQAKWYQNVRDGLYAIEQFFNEKKSGPFPPAVDPILRFISIVLLTDVAEQFATQVQAILSNRQYLDLMSKGLVVKPGAAPQPGEFFMSPLTKNVGFSIDHKDSSYDFSLRGTMGAISLHGKRVSNQKKANDVNHYLVCMFSQAFCSYITQVGPTFMQKSDRDKIVGLTIVEKVSPPYAYGEKASAMKELLIDAADDEWIVGFAKENFGVSATKVAKSAIKSFNPNMLGDAQGSLLEAVATRKFAPIKKGIKDFVTSMAGSSHAKDKVKSYNQE